MCYVLCKQVSTTYSSMRKTAYSCFRNWTIIDLYLVLFSLRVNFFLQSLARKLRNRPHQTMTNEWLSAMSKPTSRNNYSAFRNLFPKLCLILKEWFLTRFPPNFQERFLMSSASPEFVFGGPKIKQFCFKQVEVDRENVHKNLISGHEKKIGVRRWHQEFFLKIWGKSTEKPMCYNQTKFVKNELYVKRFHGNGLKNLNSAVLLKITPPKKKFGARGWHRESFLKISAQSDQNLIF